MTLSALKRAAEQATRADNKPDGDPGAIRDFYTAIDPQTVLKLIKAVETLQCLVEHLTFTRPNVMQSCCYEEIAAARRALQELGL